MVGSHLLNPCHGRWINATIFAQTASGRPVMENECTCAFDLFAGESLQSRRRCQAVIEAVEVLVFNLVFTSFYVFVLLV